jgi:hypothetical protein
VPQSFPAAVWPVPQWARTLRRAPGSLAPVSQTAPLFLDPQPLPRVLEMTQVIPLLLPEPQALLLVLQMTRVTLLLPPEPQRVLQMTRGRLLLLPDP